MGASLPLHPSSRTQVPLIQSFLQPFSRLPFPGLPSLEGMTFRAEGLRLFSIGESANRVTTLVSGLPVGNLSGEPSKPITRLVANLSRWSQKIGQAMPLTPLVTVTPASRGSVPKTHAETSMGASVRQCLPAQFRGFSTEPLFQVRVQGQVVAEFPSQSQANTLAQRLKQVLRQPEFEPTKLRVAIANGVYQGKAGDEVLFTIDADLERALHRNGDLIAIAWINNLRAALAVPSLNLAEAQTQMYELTQTGQTLGGTASWYGPYFHGRLTAAGETFNQHEFTAAHPSLPFDTYLKVTNLQNGNTVVVRVNDRGPYVGERSLDLSRLAARCLGSETAGVVPYEAVVMEPGVQEPTQEAEPGTGAIAQQP